MRRTLLISPLGANPDPFRKHKIPTVLSNLKLLIYTSKKFKTCRQYGEMMTRLSTTFPSVKLPKPRTSSNSKLVSCSTSQPNIKSEATTSSSPSKPDSRFWSVYLILSTNVPIKTYVGVTTDFSRRLKQHNGELKGGAKSSRAGRPWICACLIHGFKDQNEACAFESKWKTLSRSLPRKRKDDNKVEEVNDLSLPLLQHRQAALNKVKGIFDCTRIEIDWKLNLL